MYQRIVGQAPAELTTGLKQGASAGSIEFLFSLIKSKIRNLKSAIEPLPLPSFHKQWEVVFPLLN